MSIISDNLSKIKPSITIAITSKAKELRAAGVDVIGLGAGEPDFGTPDHIKQAGIDAINSDQTKYTAVDGTPELKQAISDKFKRENGLDYSTQQVTVGTGGKQVLYNALMASINKGDEVIVISPYWVSYPDMVTLAGGTPVIINSYAKDDFKLRPEVLEAAITDKTKWVIFNSPSNPCGCCYDFDDIKKLTDILLKYPHVNIMSDDMYEHIRYDNQEFYTIAQVEPKLYDRVLTVNGVSKAYSMTGWRIGYAGGGNKDLIKAMAKIQSQSTSNPCSVSQAAATVALNSGKEFMSERLEAFDKRRQLVVNGLNAIDGIDCPMPKGAFYVFASCQNLIGKKTASGKVINSDADFAANLLEDAKVALVPGSAFGAEGFFRISYATSDENLQKALTRIKEFTENLQ